MARYLITTDTIAPADFEAYVAQQSRTFGGAACGAVAAWLPKFGTPNQFALVQPVTNAGDLPTAPEIPAGTRLLNRSRDLVDVIRPVPASIAGRALCELRTYRIAPEYWDEFLALKTAILPVREGYSPSFGVFASATGPACRIMHLWGYSSLDQRDQVRAQLKGDAAWQGYIRQILPMIAEMQSVLISPMLPD